MFTKINRSVNKNLEFVKYKYFDSHIKIIFCKANDAQYNTNVFVQKFILKL